MEAFRQAMPFISALLVSIASLFYIKAMRDGNSEPSKVSWTVWFILTNLITAAMWNKGDIGWDNFQIVAIAIWNIPIVYYVDRYGVPQFEPGSSGVWDAIKKAPWTKTDKWSAGLGALGIIAWILTQNATWGLTFSLAANCIAVLPMWDRSWRNPGQEQWLAWSIIASSSVLQMAAVMLSPEWDWGKAAQSSVFGALHLSMLYLTLVRPWLLNRHKDKWVPIRDDP